MRSDRQQTRRMLQGALALGLLGAAVTSAHADLTSDYQNLINSDSGLINYWTFEDVAPGGSFTTVADVVGGQHGTVIGTVDAQAGLVGTAGFFPGDTDGDMINNVVEIVGSDTNGLFDLQGSFTIEALVKTDQLSADNWSGIVSKGDSAWRIARNRGDDFIQGGANGLAGGVTNGFHDLDNSIWHYVALSYDQTTGVQTVYFDDSATSSTTTPGNSVDINAFTVMIGGNAEKPEREWLGLIDEVAIYNNSLSQADVNSRLTILDADPGAIDAVKIAYWTGAQASGSFGAGAGWDNGNQAPQTLDAVIIGQNGDVSFNQTLEIDSLEVGTTQDILSNPSSGEGKLTINGGELYVSGGADGTVGRGTKGEVLQTGGKLHFAGEDFEIGEDPNGDGTYTMTGGILQIGYWVEAPQFDNGWWMTNDSSAGDDLAIGRDRTVDEQGNSSDVASGVLDMSGDSEVRVANDVFLDVGYAEVHMTDNATMRVGDDLRAASADRGEGFMDIRGNALVQVEGRFSIADSNLSTMDVTVAGDATVEVGMYLVVSGQDSLNEAGVGTLTIEDNATINVGSIIYRGDTNGEPGLPTEETPAADRVADEHAFFVGTGNSSQGSGAVYQNGAGSLMTIGRIANIGFRTIGDYTITAGTFEVRGDAPISGVDFETGLSDDDGFVDGGGDVIIGVQGGSVGSFTYEGGTVDVFRDFTVGLGGEGTLKIVSGESGDADATGSFTIGGDLGFGGDFAGSEGGTGSLVAVLNGGEFTTIDVTGSNPETVGDLYIYDGATFDLELEGVAEVGRYLLISYAGDRYASDTSAADTGEFIETDVLQTLGIEYYLDYSVAGEVALVIESVDQLLLDGDFNFDGNVDLLDLSILAANFNQSAGVSGGDANGDGIVDLLDLSLLASNFGSSSVPEPAAAVLGLLGLGVVTRRRSA
ncbi:LamG-like jellyroll fold domain-containing protein [Mucisphaera calidilacus]|uniref:Dockerin domain-containing protein n=1 Tax=Mucisphaera calidilacus TaxID=2527982 RepID=A0A518BUA5_9BACT|nr:LamG-like jellyroll fold domain-containing protein [Mucisphaera calidilacus]QDU70531.1 hypothetical protein Pan265_03590 [Mucisphaera calidilacus]